MVNFHNLDIELIDEARASRSNMENRVLGGAVFTTRDLHFHEDSYPENAVYSTIFLRACI